MSKFLCVNEMTAKQLRKIERSKIFRFIIKTIFLFLFLPFVIIYDTFKSFYLYMKEDFNNDNQTSH